MELTAILKKARAVGRRALGLFPGSSGVLAAALVVLGAQPAAAELFLPEAVPHSTLHLAIGKSEHLQMPNVEQVVVARSETAKVASAGRDSLYVMGREVGGTNLLVFGPSAELQRIIDVEVGYDGSALQADLQSALPDEDISVTQLGGGLLLRGQVSTALAAKTALNLAERIAPGSVVSLLDVRPSQVLLEIELVEATEDNLRDIGVDLTATNDQLTLTGRPSLDGANPPHSVARVTGDAAGLDLDVRLRTLERRGKARILARPQLLALSGEKASFRSGGEFPFPIPARDGEIAIEFRPYGTAMSFKPTVQANGLIRLEMSSEVSSIDARNSLNVGGFTVPALITRRSQTTLELRDGETLAVGGLYGENVETQTRQTPLLGDLPLLGRLFRADRGKRQRTQLTVIVTVRLVTPEDSIVSPPDLVVAEAEQADTGARALASAEVAAKPTPVQAKSDPKPNVLERLAHRGAVVVRGALKVPGQAWRLAKSLSQRFISAARPRTVQMG